MSIIELAIQKKYKPYLNKNWEVYKRTEKLIELELLCDWIRVNFGIHLSIHINPYGLFWSQITKLDKKYNRWEVLHGLHDLKTPEEAKKVAIEFGKILLQESAENANLKSLGNDVEIWNSVSTDLKAFVKKAYFLKLITLKM